MIANLLIARQPILFHQKILDFAIVILALYLPNILETFFGFYRWPSSKVLILGLCKQNLKKLWNLSKKTITKLHICLLPKINYGYLFTYSRQVVNICILHKKTHIFTRRLIQTFLVRAGPHADLWFAFAIAQKPQQTESYGKYNFKNKPKYISKIPM